MSIFFSGRTNIRLQKFDFIFGFRKLPQGCLKLVVQAVSWGATWTLENVKQKPQKDDKKNANTCKFPQELPGIWDVHFSA